MKQIILQKNTVFHLEVVLIIICSLFFYVQSNAQSNRIWSTYYGGPVNEQDGGLATDAQGNVYVAGYTYSSSGIASGGFQNTFGGGVDAFLAKFDSSGNRLWATYYGGPGTDIGYSVAVDASGNVYLGGYTASTSGIASGGFQNSYGGGAVDAFLVKFDSNGNRLWATYYGGAGDEESGDYGCVATDAIGNVYLLGYTTSTSGIASGGFQNTHGGGTQDAFLVKFDSNGNRLWATYYGGTGDDWGYCVHTDISNNVYITGRTNSVSGIASGGFQNIIAGGFDAFIVKFDSAGNRIWASYYGGSGDDYGFSVAPDVSSNIYLTGATTSVSGIASGGFQNIYGGGSGDAFLVKFDSSGNRLWSTYYGGSASDYSNNVATDASSNVYLAGDTYSSTGISSDGFQDNFVGTENEFLVKFDSSGNRLCATYYGQGPVVNDEDGRLAVDGFGSVYLLGNTASTSGIASGGFQNTYGGGPTDDYLVKFSSCSAFAPPVASFQSSDTTFCTNDCINYTDLSSGATAWQWTFTGGTPSSSTNQNPQGICYDSAGNYDVKLIAFNSSGSDTVAFINFIKVFASPPTPTITKSSDTLFCNTDPTYTSYQWYNDSSLIIGATDTFLLVSQSGNYNVSVRNENGCSIAVGINVVLGIQSPLQISCSEFIVIPNPTENGFVVILGRDLVVGKILNVDLYNILGNKIYSNQLKTDNSQFETHLDVNTFAKGVYLIQLSTEDKVLYRTKLIKE